MLKRVAIPSALLASVAAAAAGLAPQAYQDQAYQGPYAPPPAPPVPAPAAAPVYTPVPYDPVRQSLAEWNRLRQSDAYDFADYARFMTAHPGWPGESSMRSTAERRLAAMAAAPTVVVNYFTRFPPRTATGHARYAEALAATGRVVEAQAAAVTAWTTGSLPPDVEVGLQTRFGQSFTVVDHDRRMEALLWAKATAPAMRQLTLTSPERRALYLARLALQANQPGAGAGGPGFDRDPGYVVDRANWLRNGGQSPAARAYLAGPLMLEGTAYDPAAYLNTLLTIARGAATDNQSSIAFQIAQKADAAFPAGTDIRQRDLDERDPYTSLVWLGAFTALKKLGRPADAATLFARYAQAAQSAQSQTRGLFWAGRAAQAAGNSVAANAYFGEAANFGDQFYGQLAAERIGRPVTLPAWSPPPQITDAERQAFEQNPLVRAVRLLGRDGRRQDQTAFVRALANSAKTPAAYQLTAELSRSIGRPDLNVMVARAARAGTTDPARFGFPVVPVPGTSASDWVMIHAISRQESQFDREATSPVGAKGLMQLMPGTAKETAGKLGLPYDHGRLTSDPQYNIMLGSSYFRRLLDYYSGSYVLAVASYNAGMGNVNRFIRENGDPRMPGVDVVDWIEAIPFNETRGYVHRVLENAVVYDLTNPARTRMPAPVRLSSYLGRRALG